MNVEDALKCAKEWSAGYKFDPDAYGWRVVCHVLAEEVERLRAEANPEKPEMVDIDDSKLVTLLSSLVLALLMSISDQQSKHSTLGRKVRAVEEAVRNLAKLNAAPLDADLIEVGVKAWNCAIKTIQDDLSGGAQ